MQMKRKQGRVAGGPRSRTFGPWGAALSSSSWGAAGFLRIVLTGDPEMPLNRLRKG